MYISSQVSLKFLNYSQELLEAVEQEKNVQADRSRTTAVFRHPMLGHFEVSFRISIALLTMAFLLPCLDPPNACTAADAAISPRYQLIQMMLSLKNVSCNTWPLLP